MEPKLTSEEWDLIIGCLRAESVDSSNHDFRSSCFALASKIRSQLDTKLDTDLRRVRFPLHYHGWTVSIRMGHEFKGTRGSVRKKRGYVAVRVSDGKVVKFPPSYDASPSLAGVKGMIDAEERAKELYR